MWQTVLVEFNLNQQSAYATFTEGGTLDLVIDNRKNYPVFWIPFSHRHFFISIDL